MLRAVLFDMDGVLIDSESAYWRIQTQIAGRLYIPLSHEFKIKYCGIPSIVFWQDVVKLFSLDASPEALCREEWEMLLDFYEHQDLMPIERSVGLLKYFVSKGVKCAIATSNSDRIARGVVGRLGLQNDVSFISNADKVQRAKPAPDIFLLAAEALNIPIGECLVIEDSANGITAAKAAGMAAIGFVSPNSGNQNLSLADYITDDLGSLTYEFCNALVTGLKRKT